jgi:hypothetical protein
VMLQPAVQHVALVDLQARAFPVNCHAVTFSRGQPQRPRILGERQSRSTT